MLLELELAGLDLRQVEDVVDHLQQVPRGVADLARARSRCSRVVRVAAQQVGQADDGVHRRADLVAHVGQEGALGTRPPLPPGRARLASSTFSVDSLISAVFSSVTSWTTTLKPTTEPSTW